MTITDLVGPRRFGHLRYTGQEVWNRSQVSRLWDRRRQGRRARYRGVRKNLFDLRRASAIQNLEAIQRKVA